MKKFLQNLAKFFVSIFNGFCIGLANMVAGLSGGTIAVIRGVYDDMLDLYSNLVTHLFKAVHKHWRLIVGIVIGVVVGTLTISKAWKYVPLPVTGFFAGMVLFSLIPSAKNLKIFTKKDGLTKGGCFKTNLIHFLLLIIPFGLMAALPSINSNPHPLTLSFKGLAIAFGLGLLSSVAMVLPGVSGSLLMAAFGYYDDFTNLGKEIIFSPLYIFLPPLSKIWCP
jgi:putative membrane protein